MRGWYRKNADLVRDRVREYQKTHPDTRPWRYPGKERVHAHNAVNHAISSGRMVRQPCERCGAEKVHAHHDDYSKPLEVRWLCSACHGIEHRVVV